MPVYDHSYRRLESPLPMPTSRWLVIARMGVVERLSSRWFDALLVLALLPFAPYVVRIFLEARIPELIQSYPQVAVAEGSFQFLLLHLQLGFAFLVTIFAGSGAISGDLRTRALPLYLSKPIDRLDYVLGKALVPAACVAIVTLLPTELLLALRILVSEGSTYLAEGPLLALRIGAVSLLFMLTMSVPMLALSALTRSSWLPGLGFAILFLFGRAFTGILRFVFDSDLPILLSVWENILRVGNAIFGAPPSTGPSWLLSTLALAVVLAISALVLHLRIRAVDVVTG